MYLKNSVFFNSFLVSSSSSSEQGLIEAEAQRIATDIKRLAAPNSPDKNHFMVEMS